MGPKESSMFISSSHDKVIKPRPFLKWAGSKKQLLEPIKNCMLKGLRSTSYRVFVDAFLGSGAVTFMVLNELVEIGNIWEIVANDCNQDLINCFNVVKCKLGDLLHILRRLEHSFRVAKDPEQYYIKKRRYFNDRNSCCDPIERSALFIFLNHTCFNGLYRVNSLGEFNVPYGHNHKAKIFSEEVLEIDSEEFNRSNVVFTCGDFQIDSKLYANRPDEALFYFDPPYRPLTATSAFNKYTKCNFDEHEQIRLARYCDKLRNVGAGVIVSNSDTRDNYYENNYKNFKIERVHAVRMVNANIEKRGKVSEVLLSCFT